MSRRYCPACRLRFAPRDAGLAAGKCPRCEASIPPRGTVDANAWLASTVLAELRASRGNQRGAPRPRRASPTRAAP